MSVFVLIPLLPLLAFLTLALGGRRLAEASHKVGIPAIVLSFGLSVAAFVEILRNGPQFIPLYRLLQSGRLVVDLGLYIDQLTVLLLLLVTGVSAVVHIYSSRYMIGDPRYSRFFAVMALFTFSMVTLVMSSNLLMTYICWEVMGICSYLLISHWAGRKAACQAATKAFLVNAVADVGLGFGVILTFFTFGTLDIQQILARAESFSGQSVNLLSWAGLDLPVQTTTLIVLCLFVGTLGKSAQVPLHVWLPFAMEAPTPVSALIHAATMVNAGPFLLVRFSPLVMLSPVAMSAIAIVGATTALFAALVALTQTDIKKLLAYSTISQIGFMIMTCGVGAFVAAIFHLLAHGFLKAFLFLSTGNALQSVTAHANSETGPIRGPQARPSWSVSIGALIFACIPPFILFSGPYEAMWAAHDVPSAKFTFWAIGSTTVFFTAMYFFRGAISLFQQGPAGRELRSARSLIVQPQLFSPRHVLALAMGGVGLVGLLVGLWSWFIEFLAPALGRPQGTLPVLGQPVAFSPWFLLPLLAAVSGWGLAYRLHVKPGASALERSDWAKSLYVLFLNKLYFDEIYETYVVQPTVRLARWLSHEIDSRGIDRVVNGIATVSFLLARWLWQVIEVRGIDRMVGGSATSSVRLAHWLWRVIDVRGTEETVERLGRLADGAGHMLEEIEPRTLQHHLVVVVCWLGIAIGLLYWLVL